MTDHDVNLTKINRGPFSDPHHKPRCTCGWTGEPADIFAAKLQKKAHLQRAAVRVVEG